MKWSFLNNWRSLRATFRGGWQYLLGKRRERWLGSSRLLFRLRVMMLLRTPRALKHLQRLPRVRLWVDREAFSRIRALIQRARHTVIIQMYIWKDDALGRSMAELLVEVADRGVRVFVTKEAVGDFFEGGQDFLGTREHRDDSVWKRFWNHPLIRITHATYNDHAKVYIIDERVILLTGMNIGDEYDGPWHDYLVEIHGTSFVHQYLSGEGGGETNESVRLVMNGGQSGGIRAAVSQLLRSAERSIVLEQSYLSDSAVLQTLIERSREGVDVTVIIPSGIDLHHYSNMQSVSLLLNKGSPRHLRVFLYPGIVHGKIILVDRFRAFLGSANLISSSLDEVGEANVLLQGRRLGAVKRLREVLRQDLLKSSSLQSPFVLAWFERWLAWVKL
jgi:cardiolipin synthase